MDKYERRRLRILEWRDDQCNRSVAGLARRIDRDCSSVSRMLYVDGKAGKKRIAGASMVFFLQRYHWVLTRQLPVGTFFPTAPECIKPLTRATASFAVLHSTESSA